MSNFFDQSLDEIARAAIDAELAKPRPLSEANIKLELARCQADPFYFINHYVKIYDTIVRDWILFVLWDGQRQALQAVIDSKYTVVLKARQEGLSWLLGDAYALWQMVFEPIAEVLIFSQRDDEAKKLLDRLKGSFERLPGWMKNYAAGVAKDNEHEFRLGNGSGAQALTADTGGRSNAATYVVIDEADYVEKVERLISAAKPTIDAGKNKMAVISTCNIDQMNSPFQQLYIGARDNPDGEWTAIFLPWYVHPDRTREWYDKVCATAMNTTGSLDSVYKEYPETDNQALSARSMNTRYSPRWMTALSQTMSGLPLPFDAPQVTGLKVFRRPQDGHRYGMGLDPAGGLADGDDSAGCVVDAETYEQVAVFGGKIEPSRFAHQACEVADYYNDAAILPELNNHGAIVLSVLKEKHATIRNGKSRDGSVGKPGWMQTERGNNDLYDTGEKAMAEVLAKAMTDQHEIDWTRVKPMLHDAKTQAQLSSVDVNTLEAPEGGHDDYADGWVLAIMCVYRGTPNMEIVPHNLQQQAQAQLAAPVTLPKDMARAGTGKPTYPGQVARSGGRAWQPLPVDEEVWARLAAKGVRRRR